MASQTDSSAKDSQKKTGRQAGTGEDAQSFRPHAFNKEFMILCL